MKKNSSSENIPAKSLSGFLNTILQLCLLINSEEEKKIPLKEKIELFVEETRFESWFVEFIVRIYEITINEDQNADIDWNFCFFSIYFISSN